MVTPDVPCKPFAAGNDLSVCTASYLAGPGDDAASAVGLAPDGAVVFGGTVSGTDLGVTAVSLLAGGNGAVVRLGADGRTVQGMTRLGTKVNDLSIDLSSGHIAVAGDFGLAVLSADGQSLVFDDPLSGEGTDVAVGADGSIAVLVAKKASVFDASGKSLGSFDVAGSTVNDLAVSPEGLVIVTGFTQDDGPPCTQLQIPFIRAYDRQGTVVWRDYDWGKATAGAADDCADTRGLAVSMGRDGKLYFAGESHGGNTIFRRNPADSTKTADAVVNIDAYTDPYNMNGAAPVGFFGRFDPATGQLERAQRVLTRLDSSKGNAARPVSIAADEHGNVIVVGNSACCIPEAASKTINGVPAFGAYAGGAFVLMISSDFTERLQWTTFNGALGAGASSVAVSAGGGRMAAVFTQKVDMGQTTGSPLLTFDAPRSTPAGGTSDGYVAVWRGP